MELHDRLFPMSSLKSSQRNCTQIHILCWQLYEAIQISFLETILIAMEFSLFGFLDLKWHPEYFIWLCAICCKQLKWLISYKKMILVLFTSIFINLILWIKHLFWKESEFCNFYFSKYTLNNRSLNTHTPTQQRLWRWIKHLGSLTSRQGNITQR